MKMAGAHGCFWFQKVVSLKARHRGCHLVTEEIVKALPDLEKVAIGILHLCIQHTSASIALNEVNVFFQLPTLFSYYMNWDPSVRTDMEMMLNHIAPEKMPYRHTCEGSDDMPAHVKCALIGSTLSIPITDGRLNLGTWQGVWLCEHRDNGGARKIVATIQGALK